ncbi:hypothetical protein AV530_006028 [Patagioenas fasciata monilis]|uniref:Uncharacterized protein n=1 Tax=Patagioenas fasciata monilis TaxID=372326 RepID=A0A1V4J8F2_PATFA|nr:hypothetical protein AV530_006028 [Patagioenas fasciata monilis]
MPNLQRRKIIQNGIKVIAPAHVTNSVQNMDKALPANSMGPGHVNPPKDRWRRNTTCNMWTMDYTHVTGGVESMDVDPAGKSIRLSCLNLQRNDLRPRHVNPAKNDMEPMHVNPLKQSKGLNLPQDELMEVDPPVTGLIWHHPAHLGSHPRDHTNGHQRSAWLSPHQQPSLCTPH